MYFRKKETFLSPLTWYLKHSGSRHEPPRPHTYPPHPHNTLACKGPYKRTIQCAPNTPLNVVSNCPRSGLSRLSVSSQLWRFTNNSLGLPPALSLFACFYESVSYVYFLFSTCVSNCVASAVWSPWSYVLFVLCSLLCSILITMFLCTFFFFRNLIDTCVTVSIDIIIPLLVS